MSGHVVSNVQTGAKVEEVRVCLGQHVRDTSYINMTCDQTFENIRILQRF